MNSTFTTISGLLGGLAVFIFGMNMMSEGLQKAAGEKMKKILGMLTRNPLMGILAGALVTGALQSSSATTVMVIGFVSAGLMSLPQAISVIFGANIGTTMTAQIIAFKIDDFIWPIVFIGFVLFFFSKKEVIKNIGQTIFAFGLLFVGIMTMGDVMKPLAASPVFTNMIARVADVPVLGVLLGTLMTLVVQSSSATIAVLQNFAMQPGADGVSSAIGLAGAIPILLGDNIGTTITAILASVGQSKNAKRTAVAHSIFNITGSFIFIWIIPWFAKFIEWISPKGTEIQVISRQIANAHTAFNLINTILWLPFIWLLVKIVAAIIPGKDENEGREDQPVYLDENMLNSPILARHLIRKEVIHMAERIGEIIENTKIAFTQKDEEMLRKVRTSVENVEAVQGKSVQYLSLMLSEGLLTEEQAKETVAYTYIMNELARIGEYGLEVANSALLKKEKGFKFSKEAVKEIEDSLSTIANMVDNCAFALQNGDRDAVRYNVAQKQELLSVETRLMKKHMERVKKGKCSPEFTVPFTTVLHSLERMNNNCIVVAEKIVEEIDLMAG